MWSITVHPAQLAFQLPRGLFSLSCHVAGMIYFQYIVLISYKFTISINWKHEIIAIVFASLVVLTLYLCMVSFYLCITKWKLQKEEGDFRKNSSSEMKKWRKSVKDLATGRERKDMKDISVMTWWYIHKARSIKATCRWFWNSSPQSMSETCSASFLSFFCTAALQLAAGLPALCAQAGSPACTTACEYTWHTELWSVACSGEGSSHNWAPMCNLALCTLHGAAGAMEARVFFPASQVVGILRTCNFLGLMLIIYAWCAEGSFFPRLTLGGKTYGLHFCFFSLSF